MIIFTEQQTPRLAYTLNHIFNSFLGVQYKLTTDARKFANSSSHKINYSSRYFNSALQIVPEGLLFENHIRTTKPELHNSIDELPNIFWQEKGDIPFDLFSALFWFLSRYEEYQEFKPDLYGRFAATESFAHKNSLLTRPIVDQWLNYFKTIIKNRFAGIELKQNTFSAKTTIDVDSPWCYKNKGFLRNMAGFVRDMIFGNFNNTALRFKVLINKIPDPWHNFKYINELYKNSSTELLFFIHTGNYGKYDKTVNHKSKAFSGFVKYLDDNAEIGLHPSYKASNNKNILKNEIDRLSGITGKKVIKSRQHFLVFSMPAYYNMLIKLGIYQDYSMGFADMSGFRAGTSNPFVFFDLTANNETGLVIHPFAVMDRTLKTYQGQSAEKAFDTIKTIIENVKKVDGTFVSLWHNESIGNMFEWKDWLGVFNKTAEYLDKIK